MTSIFFDSWFALMKIIVVGTCAYIALVALLRVSGKRTLTKMNAFDFVVTVALGSTLATVLLSKDVALAEGVTAFALLIFLQYAITWLSVRSSAVNKFVKSEPQLLFYKGEFLSKAMKQERVTAGEIESAVRAANIALLEQTEAVVLETDGSLSVVKPADEKSTSLVSVRGFSQMS